MTTRSREEIQIILLDILNAIDPEIDPAAIQPDKPLREQLDIDSFDFLNVIIRLHEILGIEIPEKDYVQLDTLNSTIEYLKRRCAQ